MAFKIAFKSVQAVILSRFPTKVVVRWQMTGNAVDLADYEFYVDRGEAENNQAGFQHVDIQQRPVLPATAHLETLNLKPISRSIDGLDDMWFLDMSPELRNLSLTWLYQVRCRNKNTQEELVSKQVSFDGDLDLVGLYIADEVNFLLEDTTGTPCYIYRRKRDGAYCPKCFDPIQKKRLLSRCEVCYGTNWVGGFYDPIDAFVDLSPNPKNIEMAPRGETQSNDSHVLMANFPEVYPGDVIREISGGRMWRINTVPVTEKHRTLLLQLPSVSEIKPGDIEYDLPSDERFSLAKVQELALTRKKREF